LCTLIETSFGEEAEMKSNSKWYTILTIALALLLVSSFVGCGQSQSEAYQKGYKAGFADGYEAGLAQSAAKTAPPTSTAPEPSQKTETTSGVGLPTGAISWDKAKDHIGDRATVCGPVAGTKYGATSRGRPTWLNIGKDYPSSERFVVIIWGENRGNFPQPPESYYNGKTICVTGLIQEYEGIAQIEVTAPGQIKEQ
jgi:hypothetical protein